ncbi:MAG TPA: histidine phosphatase family protein [Acetobacteraceae bacterium]|nr:histidine phosphatase family protein [Acetobacteraceae bacterium]
MSAAVAATSLEQSAFWFLRHGETDWNTKFLAQGNLEVPLNEHGMAQARVAAEMLRGRDIRTVVSSPLSRARITAEMAAAALGLSVEIDPELHEVEYGVMNGVVMAAWFDDWVAGKSTPDGAESFADLRARAVRAVNRALDKPGPVLVVAHGGLFRAVRAEMGMEPNVRAPNAVPFWCEPGAPWTLTAANLPVSAR